MLLSNLHIANPQKEENMDISSIMGTLLSKESVEGVAEKTGASASEVKDVLSSALPALFNGANKQSTDSGTAEGFANALKQHAGSDTSSISSFLSKVDLSDGAKIVGHLLGKKEDDGQSNNQNGKSDSIVSAAAPLFMSLLGKQTQNESNNSTGSSNGAGLMGNLFGKVDFGSISSSLLNNAAKKTAEAKKTVEVKKSMEVKPASGASTEDKKTRLSSPNAAMRSAAKASGANKGTLKRRETVSEKKEK